MKEELLLLNSHFNRRRFDSLQQMLIELSVGNFYFRVERSGWDDPLEALGVLANMMAEELEASSLPRDFKDRYLFHDPLSQTAIILDEKLLVRRFHPKITALLDRKAGEVKGRPLAALLDSKSRTALKSIETSLAQDKVIDVTIKLAFKTGKGLLLPVYARLFSLSGHSSKQGINLLMTFQGKKKDEGTLCKQAPVQEGEKQGPLHHSDARNLRKVRNHILGHAEEALPPLKSLAHAFGLNEAKLNQGFKQLYGCTVFEFHKRVRLRRGKLLIESTRMPLKNVAATVGYNSLSHFSRLFKKYYGFAPSMLKNPSKPKR